MVATISIVNGLKQKCHSFAVSSFLNYLIIIYYIIIKFISASLILIHFLTEDETF